MAVVRVCIIATVLASSLFALGRARRAHTRGTAPHLPLLDYTYPVTGADSRDSTCDPVAV
jgi:hypothetical protein